MRDACFQLKAGLVPLTTLELLDVDMGQLAGQLAAQSRQAPRFFEQLPLVVSLDRLEAPETLDVKALDTLLREHGVVPVLYRGGPKACAERVRQAGFPHVSAGVRPVAESAAPAEPVEPVAPVVETRVAERPTRIVTTPVRSGQQIYAAGGDLIVIGPVSEGAEVLADGNIHVYGSLRGRALAGARGDTQARIFVQRLEAELISIAGIFKLTEDLQGSTWGQGVQAWLENEALHVKPLS